jgi:antitoxin component YwqK of YwqJK toxin-antitoxin module
MSYFRIFVVLFFLPFIVYCQSDTIEINQLTAFSKGKFEVVEKYIKSVDLTYMENYVPTETIFYFQEKPFTGVAKTVDSRQITFITFKNGVIHGRWYDQTIWNGNLTFEGHYENGKKYGIWKTSNDNKMIRLESFRDDKLNGFSINYQDYTGSEYNFQDNSDSTNKTVFRYLLNDTILNVKGFLLEEYKDDGLISETCFIGKAKSNGELKCLKIINGDTTITEIKYFYNGKYTGERTYCADSKQLYRECYLLENGLVENIEYDCYTGNQEAKKRYKPKTIFASSMTYFMGPYYELQE